MTLSGADLSVLGNVQTADQLISTVATGTAPLSVASTTVVANLNADMVDGHHADTAYNSFGNSTVPVRHASGYLYSNYFNMTADDTAVAATMIPIETGNDGFLRWQTPANFRSSIGMVAGGAGDIWVEKAGDTMTGILTMSSVAADTLDFSGASTRDLRGISINGRAALTADETDGYLRLNQDNATGFTNGVYTPGNFRTDGLLSLDGIVNFAYNASTNGVDFNSADTTSSFIRLLDSDAGVMGSVYGDTNGTNFGLLDGDGNWAIRSVKDTSIDFLVNNSEKMAIETGGNVGIGLGGGATSSLLDVNGTAEFHGLTFVDTSILNHAFHVYNTGNASTASGMRISAGTATAGTLISFYNTSNSAQGDITFNSGTVSYNAFTGGHYIHFSSGSTTEEYPYGTLLCLDSTTTTPGNNQPDYGVSRCDSPYESSVMGVYSQRLTDGENYHLVSAVGDGHVYVTNENGPVKKGDQLVSSSTPGYAMKATKAGNIIGTATTDWDGQGGTTLLSIYYYPGVFYPGPSTAFSSEGELLITGQTQNYAVTPVNSSPLENILGASQAVVGKITVGLVSTKELIVQQTATIADLSVTNLDISGQSINDYIRNIVQLELQNQPTPLPEDAIAQNFNSGMVINNYNTTVTIVSDPAASSSTTFSATGSGQIANYFNVTEVTEVKTDARFDILASLISWSDAAVDGIRTLFINAPTTFKYLAWFQGPVKVNADTSGTIMIPANTLKARVSFSTSFPETPTIYVNFTQSVSVAHTITDVNQNGFTINFVNAPTQDLTLQWLALLRGESETGPSLEVMETGSSSGPATVLPTATPTPTPAPTATPTPTPEVTTTPPEASSSTGLSDLLVEPTPSATDSAAPAETASSSATTP
jgi:hypothetical protein